MTSSAAMLNTWRTLETWLCVCVYIYIYIYNNNTIQQKVQNKQNTFKCKMNLKFISNAIS